MARTGDNKTDKYTHTISKYFLKIFEKNSNYIKFFDLLSISEQRAHK